MNKTKINNVKPSQQQLNTLLELYQAKRYVDAEKLSLFITKEFPEDQFAWNVLVAVLKLTGRINESLITIKKSIKIDLVLFIITFLNNIENVEGKGSKA